MKQIASTRKDRRPARKALQQHLESVMPWGVRPKITFVTDGAGFLADEGGAYYRLASQAIAEALLLQKIADSPNRGGTR
ncbi:hypothetical protein [Nocardia arthritidis]|uniref:Uncharacterized protein n=1 Tax=Nocardia arthritidis TaxID=228602 RepID=A0A6G9YQP7_9NOCA|nr:hypothetical protein [Nocardia arthritidis]QIS15518.1 hypothetical protein F5544_38480 [Nocardia arthritidis]